MLKATSKSGNDRFYVMALSDLDNLLHRWYYSAYEYGMSDYATATLKDFGTGKANTETMIEKWNNSSYGSQNGDSTYTDVWKIVQEKYAEGWFVPSANEWAAFGSAFKITSSNYNEKYGLNNYYWSSSQYSANRANLAGFNDGYMGSTNVNKNNYVRLCTNF